MYKKKEPVYYDEKYLAPYLGVLSGYLRKRGITLDTARNWKLGLDKEHSRAIFPVFDCEGKLAVIVGRDITGRSKVKYSFYSLDTKNEKMCPFIDHERFSDFLSPTKSLFLYGEDKAFRVANVESDRITGDLIVVEGQMDVLNMWQLGYNVVATSGSMVSNVQLEKLITLLPKGGRLVVMGDGDSAGKKMIDHVGKVLKNRVPVYVAVLENGLDPGGLTETEARDILQKVVLF